MVLVEIVIYLSLYSVATGLLSDSLGISFNLLKHLQTEFNIFGIGIHQSEVEILSNIFTHFVDILSFIFILKLN